MQPDRTTADQLLDKLRTMGYRVQKVHRNGVDRKADGINIWRERTDRWPWTTIWAPIPDRSSDPWLWGDNFEFNAAPDCGIDELTNLVIDSMRRSRPII